MVWGWFKLMDCSGDVWEQLAFIIIDGLLELPLWLTDCSFGHLFWKSGRNCVSTTQLMCRTPIHTTYIQMERITCCLGLIGQNWAFTQKIFNFYIFVSVDNDANNNFKGYLICKLTYFWKYSEITQKLPTMTCIFRLVFFTIVIIQTLPYLTANSLYYSKDVFHYY